MAEGLMRVPEKFRVREGAMGSDESYGCNGAFIVRVLVERKLVVLKVIASDGEGWEHVSVSRPDRVPTWAEMCAVKALFWQPEACVVQYHPPESDYVNCHPYCLHLWRPVGQEIPRPPAWMVGAMR